MKDDSKDPKHSNQVPKKPIKETKPAPPSTPDDGVWHILGRDAKGMWTPLDDFPAVPAGLAELAEVLEGMTPEDVRAAGGSFVVESAIIDTIARIGIQAAASCPGPSSLLTCESVTEGHPDKVADQISDAILDAHLKKDPEARVAVETLVTGNRVVLAGEITSRAKVNHDRVVRQVVRSIGYDRPDEEFSSKTLVIESLIRRQAREIADGVDRGGAGDQGIMIGYACNECIHTIPAPLALAHRIAQNLASYRCSKILPWLRPDGKCQVTMEYRGGRPVRVAAIVVSCQHEARVSLEEVRERVGRLVLECVIPRCLVDADTIVLVNPAGSFVQGGPAADTGLTGRKIIVDTYGGAVPHGGGAFSGKDPTKVDRSAAYMARHIAVSLVGAGIASKAVVQLAYAIGKAQPVSVSVSGLDMRGAPCPDLCKLVLEHFPLTPQGIIDYLELRRPIYLPTATYGHFGRLGGRFPWERRRLDLKAPVGVAAVGESK